MDWVELGYLGLFLVSFLAATILPFSSDVVLAAMALGPFDWLLLFAVATTGNWLGGVLMYYIGFAGKTAWLTRYFGINESTVLRAQTYLQKFGAAAAFFVWVPVIGDPIAVALGFFKVNPSVSLGWMLAGKAGRYAAILGLIHLGLAYV
jgi:membrane protein YqaA with SNARE-associated domain